MELIPEKTEVLKTPSQRLVALNAVLGVLVLGIFFGIYNEIQYIEGTKRGNSEIVSTPVSYFDHLTLEAKAVYVFDISENKVLYEKNEFTQLPLASLTKLMTALTAVDLLPKDTRITIRKEFLSEEGDTGLLASESWELKDLLDFSLVVSSNDGVRSIASVAGAISGTTENYDIGREEFIDEMNTKAKELNLQQTYFVNESGLDKSGMSGGYGSAQDVSTLLKHILLQNPDLLEATKYPTTIVESVQTSHLAKNTNLAITEIPGLIASKTGLTEKAGGNLAIIFDASIGKPIIIVVLGSSEEGRFQDVKSLVTAVLKSLQS